MTIDELENFIAKAKASGELSGASEVRIYTGWEGPEHLDAEATVDDEGTPGKNYLLLHQ